MPKRVVSVREGEPLLDMVSRVDVVLLTTAAV